MAQAVLIIHANPFPWLQSPKSFFLSYSTDKSESAPFSPFMATDPFPLELFQTQLHLFVMGIYCLNAKQGFREFGHGKARDSAR